MRAKYLIVLSLVSILMCRQSVAATSCAEDAGESAECISLYKLHLDIGLGFGSRSNPVDTSNDIPLIFVPQWSFYGKRFFLDNLDLGFTFYESDAQTFNLIATPGYDRVFFYKNDLQNFFIFGNGASYSSGPVGAGPPGSQTSNPPPSDAEIILAQKRRVTYLVGPEWHFGLAGFDGQLDALYEVTGEHGGTEVRVAVARPLFTKAGALVASAGATWKSSELVTYFYGAPDIYEAGPALNPFVKLSYDLPLTKRWGVKALVHFEWLDEAIYESPIVSEKYVTTAFAGVFYSF